MEAWPLVAARPLDDEPEVDAAASEDVLDRVAGQNAPRAGTASRLRRSATEAIE